VLARRSAAALLAVPVLLLAGGCSGDQDASDAPSEPADPTTTEPSALCAALAPEELVRVVGGTAPEALPDGTATRCHWQAPDGRRGLVAFVLPAEEWAQALPSTLPRLKVTRTLSAKDRALVDRLVREMERGPLPADRACEVFAAVARLSGAEPEGGAMVNFVPAGAVNPHQGVTAQRCEDGRFSSLTAYAAGAVPDRATARRTARALDALLQRVG
jgi:hypothetical protein